jgi:hypothetical protein
MTVHSPIGSCCARPLFNAADGGYGRKRCDTFLHKLLEIAGAIARRLGRFL